MVASPFPILHSSTFRFCPRASYCCTPLLGWHPTPLHRLGPYCYPLPGTLRLSVVGWHLLCLVPQLGYLPSPIVGPSLATPSRAIALSPQLTPMPCIDAINRCARTLIVSCHPTVSVVFPWPDHPILPHVLRWGLSETFLGFAEPAEGFWVSLLYLSLNCLLKCREY